MRVEQIAPALIAHSFAPRGRADDVGKQHGRQDPVVFRGIGSGQDSSIASPISSCRKNMCHPRAVPAIVLPEFSRKKASAFHVDQGIPRAMDHQRWRMDRGQDIADVNFADHAHERDSGGRVRAEPLEAAPPSLPGRIVPTRRREHRQSPAAAPSLVDVSEEGLQSLGGNPGGGVSKGAVEHQRSASLVGGGKQGRERTAFRYPQQNRTLNSRASMTARTSSMRKSSTTETRRRRRRAPSPACR